MNIFRKFTAARHYAHVLAISGPVGLVFALRLDRLERRQKRVAAYIDREKDLHEEHMRTLKFEQTTLIDAKQSLLSSAAIYQRKLVELQHQRDQAIVNGSRS